MQPKSTKVFRVVISGLALIALISGCSSSAPESSQSPTAPATTESPKAVALTPAEAKAAYKKIAQASCEAAMSLGVVEAGDKYRVVSVNKDDAYQEYSAAYFEEPDNYSLIWELDSIHSCADWFAFSMAEEAGQEAEIEVTFDPADSSFTTFEDFGEFGTSEFKMTVADGKIATATNLDPKKGNTVTIQYGNIADHDWQILVTAVDRYLEESNG